MTTGTIDFITSSGRITPIEAMPTPDLAVPYAAPKPAMEEMRGGFRLRFFLGRDLGGTGVWEGRGCGKVRT